MDPVTQALIQRARNRAQMPSHPHEATQQPMEPSAAHMAMGNEATQPMQGSMAVEQQLQQLAAIAHSPAPQEDPRALQDQRHPPMPERSMGMGSDDPQSQPMTPQRMALIRAVLQANGPQ